MTRRCSWFGVLAFCLTALFSGSASALDYPTRPVRWIVGYPAGDSTDIMALIGSRHSDRFGQHFVIKNKPGAGTNIRTDTVVHAAPDGYTILLVNRANTINATLTPMIS